MGIGNVVGMTLEAPFDAVVADARFDLPFAPAELFAGDFGAVVFAINSLSLATIIGKRADDRRHGHTKKTSTAPLAGGDSPSLTVAQEPRGIGEDSNTASPGASRNPAIGGRFLRLLSPVWRIA